MSRSTTNCTSALEFSQGKSDEVGRLLSRYPGLFTTVTTQYNEQYDEFDARQVDRCYANFVEKIQKNYGWFSLTSEVCVAVQENNFHAVSLHIKIFKTWLLRCSVAEELPQLINGLSQFSTTGSNAGKNGWFFMIGALYYAAKRNNFLILLKISESYKSLLLKFPDALPKLRTALSACPAFADMVQPETAFGRFIHDAADPTTKELLNRLKTPSRLHVNLIPPRVAMR